MNEEIEGVTVSGAKVPPSPYSEYPIWKAQRRARKHSRLMAEVVVFCSLAFLGGGLLSVVLIAHVDYFYPYLFFLLVSFFAWQRYFQRERISIKRRKGVAAVAAGSYFGYPAGIKMGE